MCHARSGRFGSVNTVEEVQELFDRAARRREALADDTAILRRHGINPVAFDRWLIEDALETLAGSLRKGVSPRHTSDARGKSLAVRRGGMSAAREPKKGALRD